MNSDLEQRLRDALHDDAARARLLNPNQPEDLNVRPLPASQRRSASSRRLVVTAAAIAVIAAAGAVLPERGRDSETEVTASPDHGEASTTTSDSATTTSPAGGRAVPPIVARAEDVEIADIDRRNRATVNIDAVEESGEVTGEFRFDRLVVTIQCADTRRLTLPGSRRDLILGGEVTSNPDGLANEDVDFAVGDRLALIIREGDGFGQRVTLYGPSFWHDEQATAGSCEELAKSVPVDMDGGFFRDVQDGYAIETSSRDPRVP